MIYFIRDYRNYYTDRFLDKLSSCDNDLIKKAIASVKDRPSYILERLSDDESKRVKEAILENKNCNINTLNKLLKDGYDEAFKYILESSECPLDILEKYSKDKDFTIRQIVSKNPNCSEELLNELFMDENIYVKASVLSNINCPKELFYKAMLEEDIFKGNIAKNKNCPEYILNKFFKEENENIMIDIASNPNCSKEMLLDILDWDIKNNIKRANEKFLNNDEEIEISVHEFKMDEMVKNYKIREAIVNNPNCDEEILNKIIDNYNYFDENEQVLRAIVNNDKCSLDILENISENDIDFHLQYDIVLNKKCSGKILDKFMGQDEFIDMEILSHKNCPIEILEIFVKDKNSEFRASVASNINCPLDLLKKLSYDSEFSVKGMVAKNPNTSLEILEDLSFCDKFIVRKNIVCNNNCSFEILDRFYKETNNEVFKCFIEDRFYQKLDELAKTTFSEYFDVNSFKKEDFSSSINEIINVFKILKEDDFVIEPLKEKVEDINENKTNENLEI